MQNPETNKVSLPKRFLDYSLRVYEKGWSLFKKIVAIVILSYGLFMVSMNINFTIIEPPLFFISCGIILGGIVLYINELSLSRNRAKEKSKNSLEISDITNIQLLQENNYLKLQLSVAKKNISI